MNNPCFPNKIRNVSFCFVIKYATLHLFLFLRTPQNVTFWNLPCTVPIFNCQCWRAKCSYFSNGKDAFLFEYIFPFFDWCRATFNFVLTKRKRKKNNNTKRAISCPPLGPCIVSFLYGFGLVVVFYMNVQQARGVLCERRSKFWHMGGVIVAQKSQNCHTFYHFCFGCALFGSITCSCAWWDHIWHLLS